MIKLFELGEDYMCSLNKEWISMIPEFKELLRRDKGSKGDNQGRAKAQAQREFTYIYLLMDFRSPYENFLPDERREHARRDAEFPDDWIPDTEVRAAIAKYQLLLENSSPSLRLLRAVKISAQPIENYFMNFTPIEPDDLAKHIKICKDLPGLQKSLKEYEDQVKQEALDESSLRGQAEKGYKEDPD